MDIKSLASCSSRSPGVSGGRVGKKFMEGAAISACRII